MFTLDYKSRLPIYEQLYQSVTRMAALGAMPPGEALPSVRSLAHDLGVNPNTVQKAYQLLERDGVIYSVAGRGSFISENGDALNRQQRRDAKKKLEEAVLAARDCGLTLTEAQSLLEDIWNGGSNDD